MGNKLGQTIIYLCQEGYKTMLERRKMLIACCLFHFFSPHIVFRPFFLWVIKLLYLYKCNHFVYLIQVNTFLHVLVFQQCFQKHLYSGPLTPYQTIPGLKHHGEESLFKTLFERRKCWYPAFSHFPTMFSMLWKINCSFWVPFCLLQMFSIWKSLLCLIRKNY